MVELQPSADLVLVGLVSAAIGIAIGYGINAFVRHRTDAMNQRRNALGNVMRTHSQNWKQQEGGEATAFTDASVSSSEESCDYLPNESGTKGEHLEIIAGAVDLFAQQWGLNGMQLSRQRGKVVQYLSPEEMITRLFKDEAAPSSEDGMTMNLSLRRRKRNNSSRACVDSSSSSQRSSSDFLHLLGLIQQYSVDTSHPNFFNQLFGALDPVALAAEIVALSVNTSAYTYETAPVFTMIEKEVMKRLGRLVFEGVGDEEDEKELDGDDLGELPFDGLMVPGGSLSNLTALHIARHRWFVTNGYDPPICCQRGCAAQNEKNCAFDEDEEKKPDIAYVAPYSHRGQPSVTSARPSPPNLVAFVSTEAHYSFRKSMALTGIGASRLVSIPSHSDGRIDTAALDMAIQNAKDNGLDPFFVAVTAGSTVRGSFDDISEVVAVCRKHERDELSPNNVQRRHRIWVHVDGAWGGSAIFSRRPDLGQLLSGVEHSDSFTFNPHKMLGAPNQTTALITRHPNLLRESNSTGAKYLFDRRKAGAEHDLGDRSYTCGRRTDAVKLWALWKYYGREGLGRQIDEKVDSLAYFAKLIQGHEAFMLACEPWPFNVNFFYLPPRIRRKLRQFDIQTDAARNVELPEDVSKEIAKVSVELKLRLHKAGEMLIPFQPLENQKADCFRLVLAGKKALAHEDYRKIILVMDKYGRDL